MMVLISVKEAAERLSISRQAVCKRAAKEGWQFVEEKSPHGGSPIKYYIVEKLPKSIKEALTSATSATNQKNGGISTDNDEIASPALAMTGATSGTQGATGATTDKLKNGGIYRDNDEIASLPLAMTGEKLAMTGNKTLATGNVAQLIAQQNGLNAQRLRQAKNGGISTNSDDLYGSKGKEEKQLIAQYENGEWWLSADFIAQLLELPLRTIQDRIAKEKFSKIRRIGTAGSKGFRYEVGLSCLSARDKEQFYMNYDRDLNHIVEELHRKYGLNISYGQMRDPNLKQKLRIIGLARSGRGDRHYRRVAERFGVSKATVYRYMKQAREHSISGRKKKMLPTDEVLRIQPRSFELAAADYAIGMILSNKWDLVSAKELFVNFSTRAKENGWRIGSYDSFLRIIRNLAPNVKRLRDIDKISFTVNQTPPIERDYSKFRIYEEFVGDQHKADYACVDDENSLMTLELFCWMDMRSRLVFPAFSRAHYNKYTAGRSLCYAMELGIPEKIYTDWGKPERSNYLTDLRTSVSGVTGAGDMGYIKHKMAMVKRSRSKPIENFFRQMDTIWKNKRIPGYCMRLSDAAKNENMQKHVKKLYKQGKLLHYRELMAELANGIDQWNHHLFVNAKADTGRSPIGIYKEMIEKSSVAFFGETAEQSREILQWFALPSRRLYVRRHLVQFKTDFFGVKKYLIGANIVNLINTDEKVKIKYDPYDPSMVFITNENGSELLGQAMQWGPIDPHLDAEIIKKIRIQKDILQYNDELLRKYINKMNVGELRGVVRKFHQAEGAAKKAAKQRMKKRERVPGKAIDLAIIAAARKMKMGFK